VFLLRNTVVYTHMNSILIFDLKLASEHILSILVLANLHNL
jgi:hypothetical protein